MLPFWISIAALSVAQGVLVALPRGLQQSRLARLRGRRWGLVPPLSVLGFVAIARGAERASANGLTYLALVAVPLLAALALGWLGTAARPRHALLAGVLFAVAWIDRGGLAGEACALALSALSCVALGALIGVVTPPRWLAGGIVAMALADAWLVTAELLQRPNSALNAAHPAAGLPRLQSAVLGHAVMGYGDLFIAGVFGALLAAERRSQVRAALLTLVLAAAYDCLFFVTDVLPATVPIAVALMLLELRSGMRRRNRRRNGQVPAPRIGGR